MWQCPHNRKKEKKKKRGKLLCSLWLVRAFSVQERSCPVIVLAGQPHHTNLPFPGGLWPFKKVKVLMHCPFCKIKRPQASINTLCTLLAGGHILVIWDCCFLNDLLVFWRLSCWRTMPLLKLPVPTKWPPSAVICYLGWVSIDGKQVCGLEWATFQLHHPTMTEKKYNTTSAFLQISVSVSGTCSCQRICLTWLLGPTKINSVWLALLWGSL